MYMEKLQEILREQTGDDQLEITVETTLEELGLDSLDFVQVIMELEDAFGVTIPDDQKFETVSELVEFLKYQKEKS